MIATWQSGSGWRCGCCAVLGGFRRFSMSLPRRWGFDQELVASDRGDAWLDPQPPRLRLAALHPGEQRRGEVGAGGVRERVPAAEPGIEIDHAQPVAGREDVAVQRADVAQPLAEGPAQRLEPRLADAHGAVGLAAPHAEL